MFTQHPLREEEKDQGKLMKLMIGRLFLAVYVAESQSGVGVTGESGRLPFQDTGTGGSGAEVLMEGNSTVPFEKGAAVSPPPRP